MNFTDLKKGLVLSIAAIALCSCAKNGDSETSQEPAPTLDEAKLMNVAQAQRVVSQFSEELKKSSQTQSQQNKPASPGAPQPQPLPPFSILQGSLREYLAAPADPKQFQTDVNSKLQKMQNRMKSAPCSNTFANLTSPQGTPSNLQSFRFEVSGAGCPIKMLQSLSGSVVAQQNNSRVDMNGKMKVEVEILDQALAQEIDMKKMSVEGDYMIGVVMNPQGQAQSMSWKMVVTSKGETFSVGAYNIATSFQLNTTANPAGSSQSPYKDISFELSHKMMIGTDLGTIYGKIVSADGKNISSKEYKVNGVDVSEEKFGQVANLVVLPGISSSTSPSSTSEPSPLPRPKMSYLE